MNFISRRSDSSAKGKGRWAFSLLELLVVLAIIAVMISLTLPAVSSLLRSTELTQGGQMIHDQFEFARQKALSSGLGVEVRFYQYADPLFPGETTGNPNFGHYRAIQLFQIQESGAKVALDKLHALPSSIIIDSSSELSPLIGSPQSIPSSPNLTTGAALNIPISPAGTQYNAIIFQFLPDGSTNLSTAANVPNWFLTLRDINDNQTPKPRNFYTLEIDATNGLLKTFRP